MTSKTTTLDAACDDTLADLIADKSTRRIEVEGLRVDIMQTDDDRARDRIAFALPPGINGYSFSTCARLVTSFLYWCRYNEFTPCVDDTGELLAFALATNGRGVLWAKTS